MNSQFPNKVPKVQAQKIVEMRTKTIEDHEGFVNVADLWSAPGRSADFCIIRCGRSCLADMRLTKNAQPIALMGVRRVGQQVVCASSDLCDDSGAWAPWRDVGAPVILVLVQSSWERSKQTNFRSQAQMGYFSILVIHYVAGSLDNHRANIVFWVFECFDWHF